MEQPIDVKTLREQLGMTQAQLADAVGVDQSTVSTWERGKPPRRGPVKKVLIGLLANHMATQPSKVAS